MNHTYTPKHTTGTHNTAVEVSTYLDAVNDVFPELVGKHRAPTAVPEDKWVRMLWSLYVSQNKENFYASR